MSLCSLEQEMQDYNGIRYYTNLKTAIANFLARDDLTSEIDDFIDLTEADLNVDYVLELWKMFRHLLLTLKQRHYLEVFKKFSLGANPKIALQFMTPFHQYETKGSSQTGTPKVYSIEGSNFRFSPLPDTSYTASLVFTKR